MRPQKAAIKIFHKLGFHERAILPELVKDIDGQRHDLIQMSCDLEELKRELERKFIDWDTQSHR
jgi:hypothetical protein